MKRIALLLLILLTMTGCEAVANINIDEDKITEKVTLQAKDTSEYKKITTWNGFPLPLYYDQELQNPFSSNKEKESGVAYYDEKHDDASKFMTASASFDFNNHMRSSLVHGCFNKYNIAPDEENSNLVVFATSEGLICDFSNFDIAVTTPYKVINSNSDNVDTATNTYIWNVTDANKKKVSISLLIDFSQKYNENKQTTNDTTSNNDNKQTKSNDKSLSKISVYIIIIAIILTIIILLLILKLKKDKNSET